MSVYNLTRHTRKLIAGASRLQPLTDDSLNDEIINAMNRNGVTPKDKKKFIVEESKKTTTLTFIIPVRGGAITGYYISNPGIVDKTGSTPLMVYCHGGGWLVGNMELYAVYLSHLAAETDSSILLLDYRLAPNHKFPTALEDCYDAFLWAYDGVKYWRVDPGRIFLIGDGVGGTLATGLATLLRDRRGPKIAGQILLYPLTDGRLKTNSLAKYSDSPTLTDSMLSYFVSNYISQKKDVLLPLFSPLLNPDLSTLPDALIVTAEMDPLSDDGKLYCRALSDAGTKAVCFESPSSLHGFMPYRNMPGRRETECAIRQFISGKPLENIQFCTEQDLKLRHS